MDVEKFTACFCEILDSFFDQGLVVLQLQDEARKSSPFVQIADAQKTLFTINQNSDFFKLFPEISFTLRRIVIAFAYVYGRDPNIFCPDAENCAGKKCRGKCDKKETIAHNTSMIFEKRMLDVLTTIFNGFDDFSLFTAIAGECYEKGNCRNNSMVLYPCGKRKKTDRRNHFFEKEEYVLFNKGNIHAIRKLLSCTDDSTKLIIESFYEKNDVGLRVIGISHDKRLFGIAPEITFENATDWSVSLPSGDSPKRKGLSKRNPIVRYSKGRILVPTVSIDCMLRAPIDYILSKRAQQTRNRIIKVISNVSNRTNSGMIMFFLPSAVLSKELARLSKLNRGYHFGGLLSGSYSYVISQLTKIDGAVLCDLGATNCMAFGAILSGKMHIGIRSRGSRLLSSMDYIKDISIRYPQSKDHFAVVISDDKMINLITKHSEILDSEIITYVKK